MTSPDFLPDPDDPPRHLEWPLRQIVRPDGTVDLAAVEQGSLEEIRGGLALACEVRVDQLPWAEDFGIPDPLASDPEAAALAIETALGDLDPRLPIRVEVVEVPVGREVRLQINASDEAEVDGDG